MSDGYKTALTEERRRFCFLVEKQCAVAKNSAAYHSKVRLLATCRASREQAECHAVQNIPMHFDFPRERVLEGELPGQRLQMFLRPVRNWPGVFLRTVTPTA